MRAGLVLVYSTEHPIYLSRASGEGWVRDAAGEVRGWGVDAYAEEGRCEERWFVEGVRKYHQTLATLLNELIDAGLAVERVVEPVPDLERVRRRPEWVHERRPIFLLVRARQTA